MAASAHGQGCGTGAAITPAADRPEARVMGSTQPHILSYPQVGWHSTAVEHCGYASDCTRMSSVKPGDSQSYAPAALESMLPGTSVLSMFPVMAAVELCSHSIQCW
jgi:hypothetical protein